MLPSWVVTAMQIYGAVWEARSHRNPSDRRALLLLLRFAVQLQQAQLRSQQFALAFIHSGPGNSQGCRQGLVLWPLIVICVESYPCVSELSSWFHCCALSMSLWPLWAAWSHHRQTSEGSGIPLSPAPSYWLGPAWDPQTGVTTDMADTLQLVPSCRQLKLFSSTGSGFFTPSQISLTTITYNDPQTIKVWQWKKYPLNDQNLRGENSTIFNAYLGIWSKMRLRNL